jgi:hypothetical protein
MTKDTEPGRETTDERFDELIAQMGDEIGPFPSAEVDGFLSHFIIALEFAGPLRGKVIAFTMPPSIQTVSRGEPFVYAGPDAGHVSKLPMPSNCTLKDSISEGDFISRPEGFFQPGKETVWMQILNLDARMIHPSLGPIRIILGETLKREYPGWFQPSHGVAQSLGKSGFPAKLFFNPCAIIETAVGKFRAIHGTLAYGRITSFPPIGTPVSIQECIPLEIVEGDSGGAQLQHAGRIVALSHPIDMAMQVPGDEAFNLVEANIRLPLE